MWTLFLLGVSKGSEHLFHRCLTLPSWHISKLILLFYLGRFCDLSLNGMTACLYKKLWFALVQPPLHYTKHTVPLMICSHSYNKCQMPPFGCRLLESATHIGPLVLQLGSRDPLSRLRRFQWAPPVI